MSHCCVSSGSWCHSNFFASLGSGNVSWSWHSSLYFAAVDYRDLSGATIRHQAAVFPTAGNTCLSLCVVSLTWGWKSSSPFSFLQGRDLLCVLSCSTEYTKIILPLPGSFNIGQNFPRGLKLVRILYTICMWCSLTDWLQCLLSIDLASQWYWGRSSILLSSSHLYMYTY